MAAPAYVDSVIEQPGQLVERHGRIGGGCRSRIECRQRGRLVPVQEVTCQEDVIRERLGDREHRDPVLRAGSFEELERVVEVIQEALQIHRRKIDGMPGLELGLKAGCFGIDPTLEDSARGVGTDGIDRARDA